MINTPKTSFTSPSQIVFSISALFCWLEPGTRGMGISSVNGKNSQRLNKNIQTQTNNCHATTTTLRKIDKQRSANWLTN